MRVDHDAGHVLAVDQGTSATKCVLLDRSGAIVARGSADLKIDNPRSGWVEQSPNAIWLSIQDAVTECLRDGDPADVLTVGISNQRESVLLWERTSGEPLGPVISWQDRRTAEDCLAMLQASAAASVATISGLPLDPMFSALKARWLLDHYDPARVRSRRGELCLGTVDCWLLSRFGGEHIIEVGNASRTQLLDVRTREWSDELLHLFGIPRQVLPRVVPSVGPFPPVRGLRPLLDGTPVTGVMGDSHGALFAHAGWRDDVVKVTYGTGSSVMTAVDQPQTTGNGVCTTVAWDTGTPTWGVEGNIRSSAHTLTWLADLLGRSTQEIAELATEADSTGVHLVPAFSGLGAPWWDCASRGVLTGLGAACGVGQLARAAIESVAFQIEDVLDALDRTLDRRVVTVLADGGPTSNDALMQLQADTSGRLVTRALARDLSAVGAGHLAGLAIDFWTHAGLAALDRPGETFRPTADEDTRIRRRHGWLAAVQAARGLDPKT